MALFPPEFIVTIVSAFIQIRLREFFSFGSIFINGLTFFLPPDTELLDKLNGVGGENSKKKNINPIRKEVTQEEKFDLFYLNHMKTSHGVFHQTLFYELYEMMIIIVTSTIVGVYGGDIILFIKYWLASASETSDTINSAGFGSASYLLFASFFICFWFPLQLQLAQGFATYESIISLAIGVFGGIISLFAVLAPQNLFDFEIEYAIATIGERAKLVLFKVGFTEADIVDMHLVNAVKYGALAGIAVLSGIFVATSLLPVFRFTRMYIAITQNDEIRWYNKLLLNINVLSPLILAVCWIKPLSTDIIVPMLMTRSHWSLARLVLVWFSVVVRLLCFRRHIQFFLYEPKEFIIRHIQASGSGPVNGPQLQSKVRIQFNYVPVIAVQYMAPVGCLLVASILLLRLNDMNYIMVQFLANIVGIKSPPDSTQQPLTPPDFGDFHVGDELSKEIVLKIIRGLSSFSIITNDFYIALLNYFTWWFSFTWFLMTIGGFTYWKNTASMSPELSEALSSGLKQNRETPKSLKNQIKSLKLKKQA